MFFVLMHVGIHQGRILVFDNYQTCPVPLMFKFVFPIQIVTVRLLFLPIWRWWKSWHHRWIHVLFQGQCLLQNLWNQSKEPQPFTFHGSLKDCLGLNKDKFTILISSMDVKFASGMKNIIYCLPKVPNGFNWRPSPF